MSQQGASFSSVLQQLCSDHYNRALSTAEYRARRREMLDQIDQHYNGVSAASQEDAHSADSDTRTVPNRGQFGTTMTFSSDDVRGSLPPEDENDRN